jgi:two-component system, cell cycle sensor histidine kinase and response regulator CckA
MADFSNPSGNTTNHPLAPGSNGATSPSRPKNERSQRPAKPGKPIRNTWEVATALELIFSGHPLAMWIIDPDSLRFLSVNEAAVEKYGYTRNEFLEMCVTDLAIEEDVRPLVDELISVDESRRPPFTCQHRLKSGRAIHVEMTMHTLSMDGRHRILALVHDVTLRRTEELKREETSTYLKALTENSPLAIAVHDTNGRVVMCNPAFETLFQYKQADVVGLPLDSLITPSELREEASAITRAAVDGRVTHVTTRRRAKDGTDIDIEIHGVPLKINGVCAGAYGIYQDIRDRKRLEEEVRFGQKMQAVGRLAGGIAHDFNNIMGVIQGYSESLLESLEPDEPIRGSVEEIDRAARRAVVLTGQLLAFSRKQVLQPKVLELNTILADMEKMLRRVIGEHIQLETRLGTDLGWTKADPTQLEQVILNLVVNARDAMPGGGKLIIETRNVEFASGVEMDTANVEALSEFDSHVALTVTDTGTGMDQQTLRNIFEPFFTTKEKGKGTGLGLATVYGIVKQSSGHIFVTSEVGRGTTFTIYLPRVAQPEDVAPEPKAVARKVPKGTECVLLVEDEESLRGLIRKFLEQCGYVVLEAKDGPTGLRIAKAFPGPIHALLTDVVMPGMSGPELAHALSRRRPETKVVFMSGYAADSDLPSEAFNLGEHLIKKPFSRYSLGSKLREVLDAN